MRETSGRGSFVGAAGPEVCGRHLQRAARKRRVVDGAGEVS